MVLPDLISNLFTKTLQSKHSKKSELFFSYALCLKNDKNAYSVWRLLEEVKIGGSNI